MTLKATYSIFSIILFSSLFLSYSGGVDENKAGAPGDGGTCGNCHGGGSIANSSVTLSNLPLKFTAGQTYSLTLGINHPTASRGGFQIVATNGITNQMVGSFTPASGSRLTSDNRLTQDAVKPFSDGKTSWTFGWTAPTGSMPVNVVFYYVGNATNGNGSTSGDAVLSNNSTSTIPVELVDFHAVLMEGSNSVQLSWTTASERNNQYFNVERCGDDQKFSVIAEIKGHGNSAERRNYTFTDDALNSSTNTVYYRLRQTDFDGKTSFSKTVSVSVNSKNALKVYPTLAHKGDFLRLETSGITTIEVVDMNGKIVKRRTNSANSTAQNTGIETITIATDDLQSGRYFVRSVGNHIVQTASFIVL
jgi:hypothetical protein